ncbi:MAG: DAK2 domain-containing protein [Spirochaetaceae bacterium]|nr:DAK2 domain-containing protein [Spirochaetaceae bacterium]
MTSAIRSSRVDVCGPEELRKALLAGADYLELNHRILDNLNVFPVPDGDTGTNMLATYGAAVRELEGIEAESLSQIADLLVHRLELNSRGNSGFIISSFLGGFLRSAATFDLLDAGRLAQAFSTGLYRTCNDLFCPVEGTMITVIRSMLEAIEASDDPIFASTLRAAVEEGRRSVFRTPELLPVLAKAGVVDSGALGFVFIMEGWIRGFLGEAPAEEREGDYRFEPAGSGGGWDQVPVYRYCTEVTLERRAGDSIARDGIADGELRSFLSARGDSLALMSEGSVLKLHMHTNEPREVIEYLSRYGRIEREKVEDMLEQMALSPRGAEESDCCVLSFVPGPGFAPIFADLGAGLCIEYGKDLPAAGEILDSLRAVRETGVIILANNKNILPACLVAKEKSPKRVAILPTGDVVQGIAAMYGFSANDTMSANVANMRDCVSMARCLLVYKCAKDAVFDGAVMRKGEYFAQGGGAVVAVGASLAACALKAIQASGVGGIMNLTLYYKDGIGGGELDRIRDGVLAMNGKVEIEAVRGEQYREELIISLE